VDRSLVATSAYPLACGRAWRRATADAASLLPRKSSTIRGSTSASRSADKNGNLGLGYYDLRHNKTGDNELTTDVWFTQAAGC
jgi:hypothetical protein